MDADYYSEEQAFTISSVPVCRDYTCPHCGTVTSKWCTKAQCDCHKKHNDALVLGGIWHMPNAGTHVLERSGGNVQ